MNHQATPRWMRLEPSSISEKVRNAKGPQSEQCNLECVAELGRISTYVDDNPCLVSAPHERDTKVNKGGRFLEQGTLSARITPARELIKRNLQEAAIKFRDYHRKRPFKPDHAAKNRRGLAGGL